MCNEYTKSCSSEQTCLDVFGGSYRCYRSCAGLLVTLKEVWSVLLKCIAERRLPAVTRQWLTELLNKDLYTHAGKKTHLSKLYGSPAYTTVIKLRTTAANQHTHSDCLQILMLQINQSDHTRAAPCQDLHPTIQFTAGVKHGNSK